MKTQSRQDLGLGAAIRSRVIRVIRKSASPKFIQLCTETPNRKNCLVIKTLNDNSSLTYPRPL